MKIAILGWGSLIWDPRNLNVEGTWKTDGPFLPIELARISKGEKLTLVLHPSADTSQTLWIYSNYNNLDDAIKNLSMRECTKPKYIGYISIGNDENRCRAGVQILELIRQWAQQKELDAVIWTDIQSNFEERTNMDFNKENVIRYLKGLKCDQLKDAEKYIRRAPGQIKKKIRCIIEDELGWRDC